MIKISPQTPFLQQGQHPLVVLLDPGIKQNFGCIIQLTLNYIVVCSVGLFRTLPTGIKKYISLSFLLNPTVYPSPMMAYSTNLDTLKQQISNNSTDVFSLRLKINYYLN